MMATATLTDAYRLFHEGVLALAEVEAAGMRVDVALLDRTIEEVGGRIEELEAGLKADPTWKDWRQQFGERANLGSRRQLAEVVGARLRQSGAGVTKTGRLKVDEDALERLDDPFVRDFLQVEQLKKLRSTYLLGLRRELVGEYVRPSFNLHLVKTYRSSCDRPNGQNIPKRNEGNAKLIRRCIIPRDGHVLVEHDFSALEFMINACFWQDSGMIAYAGDPDLDIHRDMAAECYMLDPADVTKQVRFFAKNQFVFPTLYGSYWRSTARDLWAVAADLKTAGGTPLPDHLASRGLRTLGDAGGGESPRRGTFQAHVKRVEERMHERFPAWAERKERWLERYRRQGWFRLMTGFRCGGVYSRNQLYNTPIQGPAFHILLWSLTRMVEWLKRGRRRSVVVGEIHDSMIGDVHRDELDEYLATAERIMTADVREAWPWIVVPLRVDAEVHPRNWYDKEKGVFE